MSEEQNPYQSPGEGAKPAFNVMNVSFNETMVACLKKASPWMRFIAVLYFIGAALMALFGVIFLLGGGTAAASFFDSIDRTGDIRSWSGVAGVTAFIGVFYIAIAVLIFFPGRFLYKTGAMLRDFSLTLSGASLETAFRNNHYYWKFTGILTIIFLALIPGSLAFALAAFIAHLL